MAVDMSTTVGTVCSDYDEVMRNNTNIIMFFTSHVSLTVYTITLGAFNFYLIQFTFAWLLNIQALFLFHNCKKGTEVLNCVRMVSGAQNPDSCHTASSMTVETVPPSQAGSTQEICKYLWGGGKKGKAAVLF